MKGKFIPEPIREVYRKVRGKVLSLGLSQSIAFSQPGEELLASNDISVIVPIRDAPEVTSRCLSSLEDYGGNAEVILVNDASRLEETIHLICEVQQRNGWQVIDHDKRLGHSRSCEHGSQISTRKYLCFLNSDTVVTPWSWWAAKDAFEADPRIAVAGPSTSWTATKQSILRAEYCRRYWTNKQIYAFAQKYISKQPHRSWVDLPAVGGFAFFIRRSVWQEFKGFDTRLPDYGNETELCRRLSNAGFRITWTKNSYIHHFGRSSYGRTMTPHQIRTRSLASKVFIDSLHKENK